MAIKITGMYSGLDTESIINELASAQSYKKNKLVKEQKKLSWKQDAWKALNTKIYSFYTKLDDLRLQSSYMKKKTTVSNPNVLQVSGGKVDGTHSVSVKQLSKRASLTSGNLSKNGVNFTGNATLKQLGFEGSGSIRISDTLGDYVDIDVNENMKIDDFAKAIEANTAIKANYDMENQRIYINSWASGKQGDFFFSANDAKGMEALKALKLLSSNDVDALTAPGGEYDTWSKYIGVDLAGGASYTEADYTADYKKRIEEETLSRLKAMKAQNDALTEENTGLEETNKENRRMLKEIKDNAGNKYTDYASYISNYDDSWTTQQVKDEGKRLYEEIYGTLTKVQAKNDDGTPKFEGGNPVYVPIMDESVDPPVQKTDENGDPMFEMERTGGMAGQLKTLQEDLTAKQDALEAARKALEENPGDATKQQAVTDAENAVTAASEAVSKKQGEIDKAAEVYSFYNAFTYNDNKIEENKKTIADNNKKFDYDDTTKTYMEKDASGAKVAIGSGVAAAEVKTQFDQKVKTAQQAMKDVKRNPDGTLDIDNSPLLKDAAATKIDGRDSQVAVDGVIYESANDTVTVNGLTITALEPTEKDVTVTTKDDTDGIYDMIKDFIKTYSELVNEMDSLYNAEAAKGYDPLLAEEKEALTDTEVEEWEKKIKDSLLRRDSTLSNVSTAMRMSMMQGINIGGVDFYLSDFGINTLGYFKAKDNERNAYHIDGDSDDINTKSNNDILRAAIDGTPNGAMTDKLREALEKNSGVVMDFFVGLTEGLHDTLADKLASTKLSSAMTVYNDKKMKEDYDDYTDKIKKQEEKLNAYIDKWYAKFSAMETALAKLESKNNSLSSLFGG